MATTNIDLLAHWHDACLKSPWQNETRSGKNRPQQLRSRLAMSSVGYPAEQSELNKHLTAYPGREESTVRRAFPWACWACLLLGNHFANKPTGWIYVARTLCAQKTPDAQVEGDLDIGLKCRIPCTGGGRPAHVGVQRTIVIIYILQPQATCIAMQSPLPATRMTVSSAI